MKKLVLIDHIELGGFDFRAYLVETPDGDVSSGIFVESLKPPLLWFARDAGKTIRLHIDKDLVAYISKKSELPSDDREIYLQTFMEFVIESEKKASYMAFKGKKVEYLADSKHLIWIQKMYLGRRSANPTR
ncbi:hypothetical protein BC792_11749 [Sphingobacterium allocomposti]|uniref:Uncharacterized protein n=1 Tax=Sphingobacterium allocomposti TaxID=415956 RepID=A0A5S5D9S7_9SPHI|nr:hypothetical protein [Sphingobacterium composti Yoo et al. 2007 non Ten et al. 2007]TYP92274.1 hypothetical protein BC792_11749 [Sphingobacterium composti Yoo et al. 2007 non Ten et al. 2007]